MPVLMAQREPEQKKILKDLSSPSKVAEYFFSLYPRRDVYIQKLPGQRRWSQKKRLLEDFQLLGVIEDGGRGLWRGCYFGDQTRFAVIDIDTGSKYHNTIELKRLNKLLKNVSLEGITYRSSESEGWHLYLPLSHWVSSKEVETSLKQYLKTQDYEIKGGVLEVFPSGNALRLPLQPGFGWLNSSGELETKREEISRDEALKRFITEFKTYENNWSEAKVHIDAEVMRHQKAQEQRHKQTISLEGFDDLYKTGKIQEVWELGQRLWSEGLLEKGQRHDGVLAVGHYLWYGDLDKRVPSYPGTKYDRARAKLIEVWLEKKHNGKCRHINEGNWQVVKEQIARATVWREKTKPVIRESYPLTEKLIKRLTEVYKRTGQLWTVERLEEANNKREKDARERIKEAVQWILENGAPLTISEVARVAKAGWRTVKKHIDLLETSAGVYITWGCGGFSEAPEVSAETDQLCSGEKDPDKKNSSSGVSQINTESTPQLFDKPELSTRVSARSSSQAHQPITCPQSQNEEEQRRLLVLTPVPGLRDIEAGTAGCTGWFYRGSNLLTLGLQGGKQNVQKYTRLLTSKKSLVSDSVFVNANTWKYLKVFRRDPDRAAQLNLPGGKHSNGMCNSYLSTRPRSEITSILYPKIHDIRFSLAKKTGFRSCPKLRDFVIRKEKNSAFENNKKQALAYRNRTRGPPGTIAL